MTPSEMEQEIKNLNARADATAQILPTLATKQDLLAMKDELKAGLDGTKLQAVILFETVRDQVSLLAEHMLAMRSQLDRMEARFDGIDARFDGVDARFDGVDARFEAVDARFEAVDARFDRVDARFDDVESRLDRIEKRGT